MTLRKYVCVRFAYLIRLNGAGICGMLFSSFEAKKQCHTCLYKFWYFILPHHITTAAEWENLFLEAHNWS